MSIAPDVVIVFPPHWWDIWFDINGFLKKQVDTGQKRVILILVAYWLITFIWWFANENIENKQYKIFFL